MKMIRATFFLLLLPLLMTHLGSSRSVTENLSFKSDGVDNTSRSAMVELDLKASTVTCEPTYGFLPCTTELWGQLFLIVVYQVLLSLAQQYVSVGSDHFFQIVGPGVFGAGLFHVLGAIPEIMVVLMSGLSGSSETAAVQATMGMSSNAGSAVMNLTLIWGACVAFGSYDLSEDSAVSHVEDKRPISLTGFGVTTDVETSYTARIMIISMIPFVILQLATILHSSSATHVIVLVSFIVTLALFFAYSFYQVIQI
ncbi:unnamed protein product [Ilex paraguariensis]|uniref:Sodium/calcium exchanger membrane region domain-containing protein n=1 Tax=Ilex paraguariensis TaxID=185542 RepID=A0ABC8UX55_9AQUA